MAKLPNYGILYLRYLKSTFSLYAYIFITFAPFIIGALLQNGEKGFNGYGAGGTGNNDFYFSFLSKLEYIGKHIENLVVYFQGILNFSNDIAWIACLFIYSIVIYNILFFTLFCITELTYLKQRLRGLNTQEIQEENRINRLKEHIKHKDDY